MKLLFHSKFQSYKWQIIPKKSVHGQKSYIPSLEISHLQVCFFKDAVQPLQFRHLTPVAPPMLPMASPWCLDELFEFDFWRYGSVLLKVRNTLDTNNSGQICLILHPWLTLYIDVCFSVDSPPPHPTPKKKQVGPRVFFSATNLSRVFRSHGSFCRRNHWTTGPYPIIFIVKNYQIINKQISK